MWEYRSSCAHEEVIAGGGEALHGPPKVTQEDRARRAGPGEKEKEWTDYVAKCRWLFGATVTGVPSHLNLGLDTTHYAKGAADLRSCG